MIDKPNYTQIPNIILDDFMMYMGYAEFKVVLAISRQTFGYHRERYKMSLATLRALTGLSQQGVINGVAAGMERGIISREADGDGYMYSVTINELASQRNGLPLVNEVDYPSQRNGLPLVNEVDISTPDLKKELKKELKKGERAQAPIPPASSLDADVGFGNTAGWTPGQALYAAICEAVGWDRATIPEHRKREAAAAVVTLRGAGYSAEDIPRFMEQVWFEDWRWEKKRERPSVETILEEIGKLRAKSLDGPPHAAPPKLSEEEKARIQTRARSARSSLRTAEKFGGTIDPKWHEYIEKARELGLS